MNISITSPENSTILQESCDYVIEIYFRVFNGILLNDNYCNYYDF